MQLTCTLYVLDASPNTFIFYHPQNILSRLVMNHRIVQTPPVLRYLVPLRTKHKNIFWNYSAFFCNLNCFIIFQKHRFCHMIYVSYFRLSRNNYIWYILKRLPISLVILFMVNLFTSLLDKCKAELALCIDIFTELHRQIFFSTFPDHHNRDSGRFWSTCDVNVE
jgi:hypothetical protein